MACFSAVSQTFLCLGPDIQATDLRDRAEILNQSWRNVCHVVQTCKRLGRWCTSFWACLMFVQVYFMTTVIFSSENKTCKLCMWYRAQVCVAMCDISKIADALTRIVRVATDNIWHIRMCMLGVKAQTPGSQTLVSTFLQRFSDAL